MMRFTKRFIRLTLILFFVWAAFVASTDGLAQTSQLVYLNGDTIQYGLFAMEGQTDEVNRIPDFSHAGYMGGGVQLPEVEVVMTLYPTGEDDTEMIQDAIDAVEAMTPNGEGFRGAILLTAGCYRSGPLFIEESGVVLRGEGQGLDGTVLYATLKENHEVITIRGEGSGFDRISSTQQRVTTSYVPLGSYSFDMEDASDYAVGDTIVVRRTPNQKWIDDLGMDEIGWTTSSYSIFHERIVLGIEGNRLTVNLPIIDVIEDQYGGGEVYKTRIPGRIKNCGVENLRIRSYYEPNNPSDEDHAWVGVQLSRVTDCWVKNVTGQFLGYATVRISSESNFNTIQDCANIDPRSQVRGGRRYSFVINDGLGNLFQRNYTRQGRHDFATGSRVTGPNVFLDNYSAETYSDIGPHHRWATGLLFDNVRGGEIRVQDRGTSGSGHGWAGNTTMFWNLLSYRGEIKVESPTGGMNWGIGCKGPRQNGAGYWESWGTHVLPRSLYLQQLKDRLGEQAVMNIAIPEQLTGDIYDILEDWAGEGGFEGNGFDERLLVSEDTYVRGGSDADTNFGSATELVIKNNGEGHRNDRRTFIQFDLRTLPTPIYDVTLRLNVDNDAPGPTRDAVHFVEDDSWTEESLTYNTQPEAVALIDTMRVPPNGAWIAYDITDLVRAERDGDGILSLRITSFEEGGTLHAYFSKEEETTTHTPQLAYNLTPGGANQMDPCDNNTTSTEPQDYNVSESSVKFNLAPNPVGEDMKVIFSSPQERQDIYITHITGRIFKRLPLRAKSHELTVHVGDLPGGTYIIRAGQQSQVFIKL